MTLILKHEDIAGLLSIGEVIEAVRGAFVEQARGGVQVPPRVTIDSSSGHGWLRVMPAILNGSGIMGYKAMHSTPAVGVRYLVALYDLATGTLLAQLDADWLTAQRTAATVAIATDLLSNATIRSLGILGSGEQAKTMLAAVAHLRNLPRVKVFSPNPLHRQRFAAEMERKLDTVVEPVEHPEQAVRDCDLVISVFRAGREPMLSAAWIDPGTHINAASSVRPEAREIEDAVWHKCTRVIVDDRAHAFESGDGLSALAHAVIRPEDTLELWQVAGAGVPGRRTASDITLFKSVGTALQDLALAAAIYRRAKACDLGTEIGEFPHVR